MNKSLDCISFIVAVDSQWGFSKDNHIPWHYKKDFAFFKEKTKDSMCLMGRNTFDEIAEMRGYPSKVSNILPSRLCLILSSKEVSESNLVRRIKSVGDAKITFDRCDEYSDFFYIGGLRIYNEALVDLECKTGYITKLKNSFDCDTFFNESLLKENFQLIDYVYEDEDMVIEKWKRI